MRVAYGGTYRNENSGPHIDMSRWIPITHVDLGHGRFIWLDPFLK